MNFSKTNLLSILLAIFIILAGIFAYQWWQMKGELEKKIEQNENLTSQIEVLQKEIEELKAVEGKTEKEVTITTDKEEYEQGKIVKIIIKNNSEKTFIMTIPVGLQIQKYEGGKWVDSEGVPFLACPCGAFCEILPPTFISSGEVIDTIWDQSIIWCEDGLEKREKVFGKYRFALRYVEDIAECKDAINPLSCFIKQGGVRPEEWKFTYSNEFIIK